MKALLIFEVAMRDISGIWISRREPQDDGSTIYTLGDRDGGCSVVIDDEDDEAQGWAKAAEAVRLLRLGATK